jgi:hypothetical protein
MEPGRGSLGKMGLCICLRGKLDRREVKGRWGLGPPKELGYPEEVGVERILRCKSSSSANGKKVRLCIGFCMLL